MVPTDLAEAVTVELPSRVEPAVPKWKREALAFARLLPDLLRTDRGKYVAIHDGRVAGIGDDEVTLARSVQKAIGNQAIYVGLVSEEPPRVVRLRSPVTPY